MTARGAALSLACCISLAWASPPRCAMAQNPAALAVDARQSGSETTQSAAGARSAADTTVAPLERRVSLALTGVTLREALQEIVSQSGINLSYSSRVVPVERRVSARLTRVTVRAALETVLAGTGIEVREEGARIILARRHEVKTSDASEADTTGQAVVIVQVLDTATAKPVEGAVVSVRRTSLTATTNPAGLGSLWKVPFGLQVVTVRFLGYAPAETQVAVPRSGVVRVTISLRMGMTRLQDVVTTATGQHRRYELGNDITILDVDSIVATQPVTSVTDLLEGRVPGLTVQHTSGAPGDPSRLRLRGASSVLRSNDPIVIVDGIRVYSAQSDSSSANLAANPNGGFFGAGGRSPIAAPSPLDQIDPNSIATIAVMKGPSAATMYGPDAANGVIVITTRRGGAGPARWRLSASRGMSYMPGEYPAGIYRWGRDYSGNIKMCAIADFGCKADSLVRFQALNDDRYSLLGHGQNTKLTVGVTGGTTALGYSLTGSYSTETGLPRLPDVEVERFGALHGGAAPPDWMRRPQKLTSWSGTSRLTAKLGEHAEASLSTMLTRQSQQRSSLEQQIATLMSTYVDPGTETYWRAMSGTFFSPVEELIPDFYSRATAATTNFTNAANITWRPLSWLTTSADAGINTITRADEMLLPRGMVASFDSIGRLNTGHGNNVVSTVNLRATATAPLPLGFRLQLATGANYTRTTVTTLSTGVSDLADGTSSLNGAGNITFASQFASDVTSFGWYIEPSFTHRKFTISTGLRLDGSSSFGTNVELPAFPKLGVSWLISEEPFFPFKNIFDVLRVRAAYGRAGVWPGEADRLRLYKSTRPWLSGGFQDVLQVSNIGNSQLRPERSTEMEGGFDADLLGDRLSVGVTGYRKMRHDALISAPVAPSVYGNSVSMLRNIGTIRNTGIELTMSAQLVRSDPVSWSTTVNLSRKHNEVVELGSGVQPFGLPDARVVEGYPLFGRWARPILAYSDVNGNDVIESSEVQLGDTLMFMGASEPNYEVNVFTTFSFFRGALTASASLAYQDGLTQKNQAVVGPGWAVFSPGVSDPSSSFGEQAAVAVMKETSYGLLQSVNTLRLGSISVAFNAPPSLARHLGTKALSIALQGTNMGLWTNYAGKDPNVNAFVTGNSVIDTGVLPIPRSWLLSVRATY